MNPSPPSNSPAAERSQTFEAKWKPPAWLLEIAPDDDSLIVELIDVFKMATETSLQKMRIALGAVDVPRLRTEAHRAKGGAKQIGADALAEVCQALECAPSLTPVSRLAELVDRGQELFDETGSAMTSYSNGIKVRTAEHRS
jgi:HPt (histidine-containing phosphotransfer) domain-containing protein